MKKNCLVFCITLLLIFCITPFSFSQKEVECQIIFSLTVEQAVRDRQKEKFDACMDALNSYPLIEAIENYHGGGVEMSTDYTWARASTLVAQFTGNPAINAASGLIGALYSMYEILAALDDMYTRMTAAENKLYQTLDLAAYGRCQCLKANGINVGTTC